MKTLVAVAALAAAASPALAETNLVRSTAGYTYFNRPGATAEMHEAEVRSCLEAARLTEQPDTQAGAPAGGGLIGALVIGIMKGVMDGMGERRGVAANLENCMVVRGWRVVKLEDAEGVKLADMEETARRAQLTAWIGAEQPQGTLMRAFGNEVATGEAKTNIPAGDLDKPSLSVVVLPKAAPEERKPQPKLPRMARSAFPPNALKPEQVKLAADSALFVVRLTGTGAQAGTGLTFVRDGADPEKPAWLDGRPASVAATLPSRMFQRVSEQLDRTLVFSLPPGRWRLAALTSGTFGTNFCLGGPAFDVAAGEVVFGGNFAFGGGAMGPDMDPTAARAALAKTPAVAEQLRPASYVNGATGKCGGAYIYAYEAPGAAFTEGYRHGSQAAIAAVTPPASTVAAPAEAAPAPTVAPTGAPATP